jgi:hypothetical protein
MASITKKKRTLKFRARFARVNTISQWRDLQKQIVPPENDKTED